jgi:hypothetical protein
MDRGYIETGSMTNPPTEFNKVVDLQTRQATQTLGSGDRLGELLRGVRATALKRLQGLVSTLFENIDDALFDLAEKAENNAVQTVYFDGMRKVRLKRQVVERLFQEQLGKIFNDFAAGRLQQAKIEAIGAASAELTLVDETELEENLAISSTVSKAESRLAPQLNALNQRLSVLRGGANVEDSLNPFGPGHLSQAFRMAMRELELSVNSRLIIFKLFDRYVMSNLGSIYDEVNEQLIQAGVLPQIRYALPPGAKQPHGQPLPPGMQPAGDGNAEGAMPQAYATHYDAATANFQIELYNTVRSLMAGRRQLMLSDPNYVAAPLGAPSVPITELLSALTLLQTSSPIAQAPVPTSGGDAAQFVQQVKRELLDQAGKFHGGDAVGMAAPDEDTIDLVGMLFEYILRDRNLPAQMQAVLGRLQIPYLKVALLDKHLFAQKSHPARQLLDVMAQAGMSWSEESDRDRRLYDKVNETVEKILKDFDEDLGIFDSARVEFETFLDSNKKRAELAEQRAAEATRGREKLHAARRTSAREILKRVENRNLPEIVHNVLTRPWANFLVLTLLRQGEDSNEWRQALRFADEFAWSAEPKHGDVEKTRLKSILPVLEKSLRHGLATVAYHENDVKQLMQELNAFYRGVLATDQAVIAPAEAAVPLHGVGKAAATAAALDSPVEEEIQLREEDARAPLQTLGDEEECLRQARDMKVGMWIEFTDANGTKERAKLSWISPISAKYLFVNRKGLKVSDMTAPQLAMQIKEGKAVVLEEVPLFDRALDAIVERLKHAHAATAAAAAPTSA